MPIAYKIPLEGNFYYKVGNFYSKVGNIYSKAKMFYSLAGKFYYKAGKIYSMAGNFYSKVGKFPSLSKMFYSLANLPHAISFPDFHKCIQTCEVKNLKSIVPLKDFLLVHRMFYVDFSLSHSPPTAAIIPETCASAYIRPINE